MDATLQQRPKETLDELVTYIRSHAPNVEIMADIATVEEAKNAARLGFDYIGTTLHGYTSYTQGQLLYQNDFQFLKMYYKVLMQKLLRKVMSLHRICINA